MVAEDLSQPPNNAETAARDVFVSYASPDAAVAHTVVEALERSGIRCWIAPRDVTPGMFYADEIVHAIDASRATVLILSKSATVSQHVVREVERAASKGHPLVCLKLDRESLTAGLEYFLNTSQWLEATDGNVARAIPRLIDAVRVALGSSVASPVAPHPPTLRPSKPPGSPRRVVVAGILLSGLIVAGFVLEHYRLRGRPAEDSSAGPSAVMVRPDKAVAVLPFVDLSEKKDQEYFSDGLSEELIDTLAKNRDLRVPARTSSFYFKHKQATLAEIARELGVAYVLEGSVRKSGNTLRVTAQLIQVDSGYHVWSETYERATGDIFKVQDEVATAVASALTASLSDPGSHREAPTKNDDAYVMYLQARALYEHGTHADNEKALVLLKQAVNLDPNFALAWARLALFRAYDYGWFAEGSFATVTEQANRDADLAIRLDSNLSDAHLAKAYVLYFVDWHSAAAYAEFRRAVDIDPANVDALRPAAFVAAYLLRPQEALRFAESAVSQSPLDSFSYGTLNVVLASQGRFSDAEVAARKAAALEPDFPAWRSELGLALLAEGKSREALSESDLDSNNTATRHASRALILDALGRRNDADRELAKAEALIDRTSLVDVAEVYAARNDTDRAFELLDRAFKQRDQNLLSLQANYRLKPIKNDKRFGVLLTKLHLTG